MSQQNSGSSIPTPNSPYAFKPTYNIESPAYHQINARIVRRKDGDYSDEENEDET